MTSVFKIWKEGSILVTDAGWGDSGKGKVVSALNPEIGVKIIGGHNAGHTVVTDYGELGLGLIPSSIVSFGSQSVIGQEVVINPLFLTEELQKVNDFGIKVTPKKLVIDSRSHLVMPWHEVRDALSEEARGKNAVGSLHLGIGWTYSDRINRRGLRIKDILASDWKDKVKQEFQNQLAVIEDMKADVKRKTGEKSKVKSKLDEKDIFEFTNLARKLSVFVGNTTDIIWRAIDKNTKILFEDSHGAMLDVAHGSWPFTTGVNTGLAALYRSFGGKAVKSIKKIIICSKAYQTRVGGGPMPTEDNGNFGNFVQKKGGEFGTRSGRARRCGAFDIPLISYGLNIIGAGEADEIALTKLDVLSGLEEIPVCIGYIHNNKVAKTAPETSADYLQKVRPKIIYLKGWKDMENINKFKDLPKQAQNYVLFLEKHLQRRITFIGVGKHKDAKILKN
jgi:adenylosuccinate synthase